MLRRLSLIRQQPLYLLRTQPLLTRSIHITSTLRQSQQQNPIPEKEETNVEKATRLIREAQLLALGKPEAPAPEPVAKLPLLTRIKNEALHYWHSTKLLGVEVRISSKLVLKLMRGNRLSRREQRQLQRTGGDLVRIVPVLIIVLIPFLELLLPVILYLFPNMLPSTFESKYQKVSALPCFLIFRKKRRGNYSRFGWK
jgi:hypothetical protein